MIISSLWNALEIFGNLLKKQIDDKSDIDMDIKDS